MNGYESEVPRLGIFKQIESMEDSDESEEGEEIYSAYRANLDMLKDKASFKDFPLALQTNDSSSTLNTTQESTGSSEMAGQK